MWHKERGEALAQLRMGGESRGDNGGGEAGKGEGEGEGEGAGRAEGYDGMLLLGQAQLRDIILAELNKYPSVEIKLGTACVGIENPPGATTVKVLAHERTTDNGLVFSASYLLGADGANSSVRRISCLPFAGFTWPQWKMIGTDMLHDFGGAQGFTPANSLVDPDDWAVYHDATGHRLRRARVARGVPRGSDAAGRERGDSAPREGEARQVYTGRDACCCCWGRRDRARRAVSDAAGVPRRGTRCMWANFFFPPPPAPS